MRFAAILIVSFAAAPIVRAHFVFAYIEGGEARLVFGHAAKPDEKTPATRAEKTTLTARGADGKDTKLTVAKGDGNFYAARLPATKPVVVFGTTEAGVTQRGEMPPMLSWYYPKTIVGDPFAKTTEVGAAIPMELIPVRDGDKVRFKVLVGGKPAADIEVVVGLPTGGEANSETVKSDKEGLTKSFAEHGRYCVAARKSEEKSGEFGGKKYAAIRHIATLVFDLEKK